MGLAAAATVARAWLETDGRERVAARRDAFERGVLERVDEATVVGGDAPRIWSTSNIAFRRLEAEAILLLLSERGVCASAGAACSSGSLDPSPVLLAMGVPAEDAHGAVRFSLGRETTDEEIQRALEIIPATIDRLPMATEYVATVPAGTESATGGVLAESVSWRFSTPPAEMITSFPHGDAQPLEPTFFVAFDQRIDPDSVLSTIQVTAPSGSR